MKFVQTENKLSYPKLTKTYTVGYTVFTSKTSYNVWKPKIKKRGSSVTKSIASLDFYFEH